MYFIVEKDKKPIAIEVKLSRSRNKKGMIEFLKHFKNATPLIITEENLEDLP